MHKTFKTLDIVPHVLTWARITGANHAYVVSAEDVPNPNWLRPGAISAGQQAFGDAMLKAHPFVLFPSVVSRHSWNVIFDPGTAKGFYDSVVQELFALDTRLHRPAGGVP